LLAHLVEAGHDAARLVEMTLDQLVDLGVDDAGTRFRTRYLERRPVVTDAIATSRAIVDADGEPLQAETLPTYVRALRRVDINGELNSALCRGLLHTRFDMETPLSTGRTGRRVEPPEASAQEL
jgi:hypothetical protein